jgi:hypothetical protein
MPQEAVVIEPKGPPVAAQRPARRRPEKPAEEEPVVRYFLAGKDSQGGSPSLARELGSENEALIESLKTGLSFYAVSEYRAVPDVAGKAPRIRKQAVQKIETRDERRETSSK